MIIMDTTATKEQINNVVKEIKKFGLKADVSHGEFRTIIGLIGMKGRLISHTLPLFPV